LIGVANSRLHSWQLFLPSLGVLGRDNGSPANFARCETACFDLATDRCQTNIVLTRELTRTYLKITGCCRSAIKVE